MSTHEEGPISLDMKLAYYLLVSGNNIGTDFPYRMDNKCTMVHGKLLGTLRWLRRFQDTDLCIYFECTLCWTDIHCPRCILVDNPRTGYPYILLDMCKSLPHFVRGKWHSDRKETEYRGLLLQLVYAL